MKTNIFILICLGMLLTSIQAINAQDKTNREKLDEMSRVVRAKEDADLQAAIKVANKLGMSLIGIERLDERGIPVYYKSTNNDAAASTGTTTLRSVQGVDGQGMTIGVWECCNNGSIPGGIPLVTHQDLAGRVTVKDGSTDVQNHATHVTGTLIGNPPSSVSSQSRGMAFRASADAYGITNHTSEMMVAGAATIDEVANGKLLVSNHSYGSIVGWDFNPNNNGWTWFGGSSPFNQFGEPSGFGVYDGSWDAFAANTEYYLICKAAGNDRNEVPAVNALVRNAGQTNFVNYNPAIHPGPDGTNGYDCITDEGSDKNIMTVGAVTKAQAMSTFSNWGPTNDGRIKPDICGIGVSLTSAISTSNSSYGSASGTSMASPQVAGSLLLLQELYSDKYKVGSELLYMRATTLKALAINSATDRGNPNPDYQFGFGVLDAEKAGEFIVDDAKLDNTGKAVIIEDVIENANDVFEFEFDILGGADMRVTLVYHDVPADTLVNDLDILVRQLSTNGVVQPWGLDPANPNNNATRMDNDIDNVEHVSQNNLPAGTYRAEVRVEGSLYNNQPQKFSLVISGIAPGCKASIQHKLLDIPTGTYTAKDLIRSEAKISSGAEVTYQTDGKVVLRPGFHAKQQSSTGTGFFKTSAGTCN